MKSIDNKTHEVNLLGEYKRLAFFGDSDTEFLDIDTTLIISCRDEIQDLIEQGKMDDDHLRELNQIDSVFKKRVAISYANYTQKVSVNQGESIEYIKSMLIDLKAFGAKEPKDKWWFHMFNDHND